MQRLCLYFMLVLSVLVLNSATWGQVKPTDNGEMVRIPATDVLRGIATSKVRGIEIVSSFYDPATYHGEVTFKNTSTHSINALHGQVMVTHVNGYVGDEGELYGTENLFDPYYQARGKKYPWTVPAGPKPISAGATLVESFTCGHYYQPGDEIASVSVYFDLVVYSNNTAESANDALLHSLINSRRERAKEEVELARIAQDVLNAQVENPIAAFAKSIEGVKGGIYANVAEFQVKYTAPADGADKLAEFIELHKEAAKIYEEASKLKVVAQ